MSKKKIDQSIVGLAFEPAPVSWEWKDCVLYALGVGSRPEQELDYLYEAKGPRVLPTWAVIPGMRAMGGLFGVVEIDFANLLHGEQGVELHRPLPPQGKATLQGRVRAVWDKGKAAVIEVEGEASDENGRLFTASSTLFIRGAGGFGGERGPSSAGKNAPPDREPDHVVEDETRPEQAAIYRLCGDLNPIHIDPDFARMAGFERPFLDGLCTYGFVGRAVLRALCGGDPSRFLALEGRFADQVYPGDRIVTRMWKTGAGEAVVEARTQTGAVVLSQGRARFRG